MAVQVGQFYKTCATYPAEVNGDSRCKSHALLLTEKPHCCYLVDYDPITSIGIIFLGTLNPVEQHRFVVVHGGASDPLPRTLRTFPVLSFAKPFYLNFTHPLRVKLVYLPSGVSFQTLKNMPLPNDPPPPVGISEYWKVPLPISRSVSLDPESVETFWSLHKLYRPNKNYSLGPSMAGGPGIGGSAAGGGSGSSAAGGGSSISAAGGGSDS